MKKAQSVVPVMIILIMIFFVLYVYLLPLAEKCKLMPDIERCQQEAKETERVRIRNLADIIPETLLQEAPGFLPVNERYAVYSLRPIELFTIKETDIATLFEKETVKENWFYSEEKKGVFSRHNRSEGIKMFVYISSGKGSLKININPDVEFLIKEEDLSKDMPLEMYMISSDLSDTNIIRLSASAPLTPFEKNEYSIDKIMIKEIYRKTDNASENDIKINENLNKLNQAFLYINPYCLTKEKLSVRMNNEIIKDETLCSEQLIDVTDKMKENNEIIFKTSGNYFIFPAKLHLKFDQMENSVFYFDVEKKEYEQIKDRIALIMLKLAFDSTAEKKIDVYINKQLLSIETKDKDYETTINDYIKEGNNIIELSARTDTKINELKVHIK